MKDLINALNELDKAFEDYAEALNELAKINEHYINEIRTALKNESQRLADFPSESASSADQGSSASVLQSQPVQAVDKIIGVLSDFRH